MEETPAMQDAISPAPTSVRLRLSGSSRPSSRASDLSNSSRSSDLSRSSRSSRASRSSSSSMSSRASTSSSSLSRSSSSDSEYVPFEGVTSDEDVPLVAPPVPVVARVVPLVALPPPRPDRRMRNRITEAEELAINMVFAEDIVLTSLLGKSIGIEVVRRKYKRATMGRLGFEQRSETWPMLVQLAWRQVLCRALDRLIFLICFYMLLCLCLNEYVLVYIVSTGSTQENT
ncbi:bromodomain-containing protein DDB_G0270170-like isoform X1 [Dreissena polymorpha]|uniref:bromodomain-containing protein DDB_G0270170-like isoform X1 n=1 Tax=Dreissena polymorpha TaxID=45954 RepID=UPI00226543B3|nr:bromodomain-containing protein DDB_G0270170-like isoform X1 [Dreissena polymorpha]